MPHTGECTRSDFAPLVREVQRHRLLARRPVRYGAGTALDWLLGLTVVAVMISVGDSWWQLLLAIPAAVLTARVTFIGHDAGHQQIARSRRVNRVLGLLHGNLLAGMSYGWWVDKHNRHHANPNHTEKDPDVGVGALAWTPEQAAERRGAALQWLTHRQAALFFPMLLLEGLNLKVSSVRYLVRRPRRAARVEGALIAAHAVGHLTLLLAVMAPGTALAFFLVQQAVLGLHLGCAFAPNHKGMPMPAPGARWGHLHKQVLTSRNVRGGPVVDWLLGGLNYQVEHHLFPSMPRSNLRRAQLLVRAHCARLGLPYTETGLRESYVEVLRYLHAVGAPVRR